MKILILGGKVLMIDPIYLNLDKNDIFLVSEKKKVLIKIVNIC